MQKKGCQIFLTPYNAPPLTGNKTTQSAMNTETAARDSEKKKQKIAWLSQRKTYYTAPRDNDLEVENQTDLVATLFNNLSDNLCGHSQDTIKKIFDFKSWRVTN
ncbi:hypothetical protein Q5E86_10410, partial [Providencia sp. CRE-138-0111]